MFELCSLGSPPVNALYTATTGLSPHGGKGRIDPSMLPEGRQCHKNASTVGRSIFFIK